nr:beta-1,3-glucosyltransferase [Onthophagus taurus]
MSWRCMLRTSWWIGFLMCCAIQLQLAYSALDDSELVIVVLSQPNDYHRKLAEDSTRLLIKEAEALSGMNTKPIIHLSHLDFPHVGDWTIIPLIPILTDLYGSKNHWIIFAEDRTRIKLSKLIQVLNDYNKTEEYVGYSIYDHEPTIIHHYFFNDDNLENFKYPNIAAGFAITTKLLLRLNERLRNSKGKADFSIDPSHELALFIWDEGRGVAMRHDQRFCIENSENCATYPIPFTTCDDPVPNKSIYFAVKTCLKFHGDRVPAIKNTWGKHATLVRFFSDAEDKTIPTIDQRTSNPKDLCLKTTDIIRRAAEEMRELQDVRWLVIVDDDTILSVNRLRELLSCYNHQSVIALGERYGLNVAFSSQGYNYITMGGGLVLSKKLVELLLEPGACTCPEQPQPDDMYLGICLALLGIDITHSSLFHQARPIDYSPDLLKSQPGIVSFHRYMTDVNQIYNEWFKNIDESNQFETIKHLEL